MKSFYIAVFVFITAPLAVFSKPAVTTVPFYLNNNLIIVKAEIDGVEGNFILDTGATDLTLNGRYFEGRSQGLHFYGINGSVSKTESDFIHFNLGGFKIVTQATITNFSALEESTGLQLFGVVGNSLFYKCELVIDYIFHEVTIYRLDRKGMRKKDKKNHRCPDDTLKFYLKGKMPIIAAMAGQECLMLGLDSGASSCVIDQHFQEKLGGHFSDFSKTLLTSFGSERTEVTASELNNLLVGRLNCPPMKTIFVSMNHFNRHVKGQRLDGILGYEFLSQFRVSINFKKQEIYLWEGPTVEAQWLAEKSARREQVAY